MSTDIGQDPIPSLEIRLPGGDTASIQMDGDTVAVFWAKVRAALGWERLSLEEIGKELVAIMTEAEDGTVYREVDPKKMVEAVKSILPPDLQVLRYGHYRSIWNDAFAITLVEIVQSFGGAGGTDPKETA